MDKKQEDLFLSILEKYKKPIINYLWRYLGSKDDAEDAAQNIFVRLYFHLPKFASDIEVVRYLYKSATNAARNIFRRKKLSSILTFAVLRNPDSDEPDNIVNNVAQCNIHDVSFGNELEFNRKKVLQQAIMQLPHYQKAALELFYFEDKSYQEIAAILGKSIPSVESLLIRARRTLAEILKKHDLS